MLQMSIDKVRQSDWFKINTIALRLVEHTINGFKPSKSPFQCHQQNRSQHNW